MRKRKIRIGQEWIWTKKGYKKSKGYLVDAPEFSDFGDESSCLLAFVGIILLVIIKYGGIA